MLSLIWPLTKTSWPDGSQQQSVTCSTEVLLCKRAVFPARWLQVRFWALQLVSVPVAEPTENSVHEQKR